MTLTRREFAQVIAAGCAAGLPLAGLAQADTDRAFAGLYDLPAFGNVSLLHLTDTHAQLLPIGYREPDVNLGVGSARGQWPHRVGEALLSAASMAAGTAQAHAFTSIDYEQAAHRYGRVGGYAHLATLVKRLRATRPGALLLDGGDTWQGSATALWTQGEDMAQASALLGVDVMTAHWEFTYGMARVRELHSRILSPRTAFLAHNIKTADFEDPVFDPYVLREVGGVPVAIIGQAFPYTPIAHPSDFVQGYTFGIQEQALQQCVDQARSEGAQVVVLLSHNGMDVDLKLASRIRGIDVILGGHTHDAVPVAVPVRNPGSTTLVTNAGSHGKFLGVMDLQVRNAKVVDFRYRLLPVFADALPADPAMSALIERVRAPYADRLAQPLAVTDSLLYRRGNFSGSWDQLICDALLNVRDAQIALSPGFRWGTTLLPGQTITVERLMDQTAITYPKTYVTTMTGRMIHAVLEDVADNLFNPDPYYQQGGDMVRVSALTYRCDPARPIGSRITDLRLAGQPLDAGRRYRVAGWASVGPQGREPGEAAIWDVVQTWLSSQPDGRVRVNRINTPTLPPGWIAPHSGRTPA